MNDRPVGAARPTPGTARDPVLIGPVDPPELHVMTYNIRRRFPQLRPDSPDRWSRRKPLIRRILAAEQPTVLGVQEALIDQIEFVAASLGSRYRWVGRGRHTSGAGEHCPIYYDGGRLQLVEWRQRALSATPDAPGSRSWGNITPRVVVSAAFTDLSTGGRLVVLNTHFDHLSRRARYASARMVRQLAILEHAAAPSAAIVVTDGERVEGAVVEHRRLVEAGTLRDAWEVAGERLGPQWRTFSNYRRPRENGRRIDLILVGPGVDVLRTGINAVRFGGAAASDHEPVQAVVRPPR